MCYSSETSLSFGIIGLCGYLYIELYEPKLSKTGIQYLLLFYSFMEFLQSFQYYYVNQCSNILNQISTEIAYILVIVQPFIWNIYFYFNSTSCEKLIFKTAIILCLVWMFMNILSRVLYKKWGEPNIPENSIFASDSVCTKTRKSHLYWVWTSTNLQEFNANFLTYLMLWFIPGLVSTTHFYKSILVMLGGLTGAIIQLIYIPDLIELKHVITAIWCYISVPIVMVVILQSSLKRNLFIF